MQRRNMHEKGKDVLGRDSSKCKAVLTLTEGLGGQCMGREWRTERSQNSVSAEDRSHRPKDMAGVWVLAYKQWETISGF